MLESMGHQQVPSQLINNIIDASSNENIIMQPSGYALNCTCSDTVTTSAYTGVLSVNYALHGT